MTSYRQIYNKAKSELAKRHNEELHKIMNELGYTKKPKAEKKVAPKKVEAKKVVVQTPKKV